MSAEELAQALGEHTEHNGTYKTLCPAHDDNTPSFEITEKAGKVVFICRAGCSQDAVVAALKDRDLWPAKNKTETAPQIKPKVVARYDYRDQSGNILYSKERLEPGREGRSKEFRFFHGNRQTGRGGNAVLYHMPDVLQSSEVIICEGERKADAVKAWGLVGTSLDSGANSAITPAMIEALTGKHIVILPDNDEPGRGYAGKIGAALSGKAASIRIVDLPGLSEKGDIVDWVKTTGNDKAALLEIIKAAPEWEPAAIVDTMPPKPLFMSGADMLAETIKIRKLIGNIIERGCTCQVFGPSGDGKTFIVLDIALAVATGGLWNGIQCEQGIVAYFNGEGRGSFRRRVKAYHNYSGSPDLSDFHASSSTITFDAAGIRQVVTELRALEERTGKQVALIVIDTLARHMIGDENSTKDMSEFVRSVDGLRDTFPESSALIVHHTGKNAEATGNSRGSSALKASLDVEIQCMGGVLTFTKMKDSEAPPVIEFKLVPVEIGTDEDAKPITSCIVEYGERSYSNRQKKSDVKLSGAAKQILKIITTTPDKLTTYYKDEYCKQMKGLFPDNKPDTARRNFERAVKELIEKEKVYINGDVIQSGQPDKTGQNPDTSEIYSGRTRTTPLKGCPVVRELSGSEFDTIETFTEADLFLEVQP